MGSVARTSNAFALALACCASPAPAQTGTANDFTGSLTPVAHNGPELVSWRTVPTATQISKVFPIGVTKTGYMLWKCQVLADGSLDGCVLQKQWPPKDDRYMKAAQKLLPLFRVGAQTVRLARGEGKKILFDLPVYRRGSKPFTAEECPPPFCVPVPPPPKS